MNLTLKTDYCLRILIYLQKNKGKNTIRSIADAYGINKNHLSMAVNKLSSLGYILSTPGPKGGIEFNPQKKNHLVGNLVQELENLTIVECFNPKTNLCTLDPECKLKIMIQKSTHAFIQALNQFCLKDLI